MNYRLIDITGDNLKELYACCDIKLDTKQNSIRVCETTSTEMATLKKQVHISTAAIAITVLGLRTARTLTDKQVNKLLAVSIISNGFNDLLYEYIKEEL